MLGRRAIKLVCSKHVIPLFARWASTEEIKKYREADYITRSDRISMKIIKKDGRAFEPGTSVLPLYDLSSAEYFPVIKGFNLLGNEITIPDDFRCNAKIVSFSFQEYGFDILSSWLEPFYARYPQNGTDTQVKALQVCWIDYSFLSYFKNMFIKSVKSKVDPAIYEQTMVTFGAKWPFAEFLLLPSLFTGYVYLLDRNNKIRWKGSGLADPKELEVLFEHVDTLLKEPHL